MFSNNRVLISDTSYYQSLNDSFKILQDLKVQINNLSLQGLAFPIQAKIPLMHSILPVLLQNVSDTYFHT